MQIRIELLASALVLVGASLVAACGSGAEEPLPAPDTAAAAEEASYTIERHVVDGRNVLVAFDGEHDIISTLSLDAQSDESTITVTALVDGEQGLMRTRSTGTRIEIEITSPAGNGAWAADVADETPPPSDYERLAAPFAQHEAMWISALSDEENAKHANAPGMYRDAPSADDVEYGACKYVCGFASWGGCRYVATTWYYSLLCWFSGQVGCGAICNGDPTVFQCFTHEQGCGGGMCNTCCQSYYGCQTSCWGGCY